MQPIPTRREDVTVVPIEGDIDFATRGAVKSRLLAAIPEDRPLVLIDLSACGTVDSEGLAAFLSIAREVHLRGGQIKFCSPTPALDRLFRVTRLYFAFEVHADRQSALESF
jgi:anti-anti-sigma factor